MELCFYTYRFKSQSYAKQAILDKRSNCEYVGYFH